MGNPNYGAAVSQQPEMWSSYHTATRKNNCYYIATVLLKVRQFFLSVFAAAAAEACRQCRRAEPLKVNAPASACGGDRKDC